MPLDLVTATFWTPKEGNSEAEYEDAFYPPDLRDRRGRILRFAMSDGASEGMLSGPWAEILTRSFCRSLTRPTKSSARRLVSNACTSWETWKAAYLRKRDEIGKPVQWWEEQGLATGPFATLLGVSFTLHAGSGTGRWDAVAMGDTCLFGVNGEQGGVGRSGHTETVIRLGRNYDSGRASGFVKEDVRDTGNTGTPYGQGHLTVAFPLKRSADFNSRPILLSGDRAKTTPHLGRLVDTSGPFQRGDRFYLMTDALSAWFLKEVEAGNSPWDEIDRFVRVNMRDGSSYSPRALAQTSESEEPSPVFVSEMEIDENGLLGMIRSLRKSGKMRNDDVTLTCIRVV